MSSIFTKIIDGEIPGRFVWKDEKCVAFELPAELAAHLFAVAHKISGALDRAFDKDRVALMIAGFDVPHTHIHLFPADSMAEYDPANALANVTAEELDADAEAVRTALRDLGHGEFVPEA